MSWFIETAHAHERWFVDAGAAGAVPDLFRHFTPANTGAAIVMLAAVAFGVWLDHILSLREDVKRRVAWATRYRPWGATIVGLFVGIGLIWLGLDRHILGLNLTAPTTTLGTTAVLVELIAGALLIVGLFTRIAALGVLFLAVMSFVWYPVADALPQIVYFGIGFFILIWGRGRFALGSVVAPLFASLRADHLRHTAYLALRLSLGITFLILAADKIIRPDLHIALVDAYAGMPYDGLMNLFGSFPIDWYVFLMALIEAALALFIIFGALLRPTAALIALLMLLSSIILGAGELAGHLPIVGALLVLVVFGPGFKKEHALGVL